MRIWPKIALCHLPFLGVSVGLSKKVRERTQGLRPAHLRLGLEVHWDLNPMVQGLEREKANVWNIIVLLSRNRAPKSLRYNLRILGVSADPFEKDVSSAR
jgi:hypothetical protein